jgi:VWFA-related protein
MVQRLLALGCLFVVLASGRIPASARAASDDAPVTREVYVTAADSDGNFVPNLSASDFIVKEGGKAREVVAVKAASEPMQIALLVDDNGTGIFRAGVARFIQRLLGHAEFALSVVVGQTQKLVEFTTDVKLLTDGINGLMARPSTPDGGQLLEGIYDAAKELSHREAKRPVIVVLTVGGEEHSTRSSHNVLDQLQQSGASMHVFQIVNNGLRATVDVRKPGALLDENHALGEVLGDGPKQSGGRLEELVATSGVVASLEELAEELMHQYIVTYELPDGVKASNKLAISVNKPGVSLRAPTRIPGR